MNRRISIAFATASVSLALMAAPGVASAAHISGTVVEHNAHAHTFALADHQGNLHELHSRQTPTLGRAVTVAATMLRNGTWAASHVRVGTARHRVRIRGTVTFVSSRKGTFVVSARGVSLLVHRRAHRTGRASDLVAFAASLNAQLPALGSTVSVETDLSSGEVDATQVSDQGQNANGVGLEGRVLAIDSAARTLTISADDSDQSAGSITVNVPASFDMSLFTVGGRVELIASLNPDHTYTLEQSSKDGNVSQAQNGRDQQGDGGGDQHSSAAAVCVAQQTDPNFAAAHNGVTFDLYYAVDPSNTNNAFGRCVAAMASDHGASTSPEAQCFAERNDPNFAATHTGESFLQYYSTDPAQQNQENAFGQCVDLAHHASDSRGGSQHGSGGGDQGGSSGPSSGGASNGGSSSDSTTASQD